MPSIFDQFPSKYLAARDLGDEGEVVTIEDVSIEAMKDQQTGQMQNKVILTFKEYDKGLILNKTNASTIATLLGDDTDDWEGQKITIFPTQTDMQGKQVDCIRVRNRKPKATPAKARPERVINPDADDPDDVDDIPY